MKDKSGSIITLGDTVSISGKVIRQNTDVAQEGDTIRTVETVTIEVAGGDGTKRQWAYESQFVEKA